MGGLSAEKASSLRWRIAKQAKKAKQGAVVTPFFSPERSHDPRSRFLSRGRTARMRGTLSISMRFSNEARRIAALNAAVGALAAHVGAFCSPNVGIGSVIGAAMRRTRRRSRAGEVAGVLQGEPRAGVGEGGGEAWPQERPPGPRTTCSECGAPLEGRQRLAAWLGPLPRRPVQAFASGRVCGA